MTNLTPDQHKRIGKIYEEADRIEKLVERHTEAIRKLEIERSHFIEQRREVENKVTAILNEETK